MCKMRGCSVAKLCPLVYHLRLPGRFPRLPGDPHATCGQEVPRPRPVPRGSMRQWAEGRACLAQ